jgi:tol-pal system protein YbgF
MPGENQHMKRISVHRPAAALVILLLFFTAAGCATSSDVRHLHMRIAALEKRNQNLQDSLEQLSRVVEEDRQKRKEIADIRDLFAGQDAEFYALKARLQEIAGSCEETGYRLERQIKALEDSITSQDDRLSKLRQSFDVHDKRLSRLENFMGMEPSARFEAFAESKFPEKSELENLSEDQLYEIAKQAYDNGDFQSALQGFEIFSEKYPESSNADNARFWIGEIYFAEKWYERAILEYEKVIKNYPEENKVPGAYLKQGLAFEKLGENANARLILNQLMEKFPDSNEAGIARRKLAQM